MSILGLTPIDSGESSAQWYAFAISIAYSLVTDGLSLQSSCEMKQCLRRTLQGKKAGMVKLSKSWSVSMEYVQYLNVGWAEIVPVNFSI